MGLPQKKWVEKTINKDIARVLSQEVGIPTSIAEILTGFGITKKEEAEAFLRPHYLTHMHDPMDMRDMDVAVRRINHAIDHGEKILGHGDYDADGVSTNTVLKEGFRLLGVEIDVFGPNRFTEGYGIHPERAKGFSSDYDLIISGDTGIRAFEAARVIKEQGCDLIVTDHHEPLEGTIGQFVQQYLSKIEEDSTLSEEEKEEKKDAFLAVSTDEQLRFLQSVDILPKEAVVEVMGDELICLPDALAVVDPKRLGDPYPSKTLAGVGVVFKLLQAVFRSRNINQKPLFYLLDLVATGSIADLAPQMDTSRGVLDIEVRTMCKYGIKIMNESPKTWVRAIKEVKGLKGNLSSGTIGFTVGPMLNAPGRLQSSKPAVKLLLEKDEKVAKKLALHLKAINEKRQAQVASAVESVMKEMEEGHPPSYGIVVQSEAFHIGIAGLIASKLCEKYYLPSIALSPIEKDGEIVLKGSARSIPGVHVLHMLDRVKEKIGNYEYGGHEQAAGMTICATSTQSLQERFHSFQQAFQEACSAHPPDIFEPFTVYDTTLDFSEIDYEYIRKVKELEPFGEGVPKPVFCAKAVEIVALKPIMEGKGAKLTLKQGGTVLNAILFHSGEGVSAYYYEKRQKRQKPVIDILFEPGINRWNGTESIQLKIGELRFTEPITEEEGKK